MSDCKLVPRLVVTDTNLLESNIQENEYPQFVYGNSYDTGEKLISSHSIYESLTDSNTEEPLVGIKSVPATWRLVGPTNRFAMFDKLPSRGSINSGGITARIELDGTIDTAYFANLAAEAVKVTLKDSNGDTVYDETQSALSHGYEGDYFDYFYGETTNITKLLFSDLPPFVGGELCIEIIGDIVFCGVVVIGQSIVLGTSEHGSSVDINDYSIKQADEFGHFDIVKRNFSEGSDLGIKIPNNKVDATVSLLARRRAEPTLYIGAVEYLSTVIYGFYKDFTEVITTPTWTDLSLEIEGLSFSEASTDFEIVTPTILAPQNGDSFPSNGVIRAGLFSTIPFNFDTVQASSWQIASDSGFSGIDEESINDEVNITSYPPDGGTLVEGQTYYVRHRYEGVSGTYSGYSDPVSFVYAAAATIDTPTLTSPPDADTDVSETPTLTSSTFATTVADRDRAEYADWQISLESDFSTIAHESLNNTQSLDSYTVPAGVLVEDTEYYWRKRDGGFVLGLSSYSAARSFTTADDFALYGATIVDSFAAPQDPDPTSLDFNAGNLYTLEDSGGGSQAGFLKHQGLSETFSLLGSRRSNLGTGASMAIVGDLIYVTTIGETLGNDIDAYSLTTGSSDSSERISNATPNSSRMAGFGSTLIVPYHINQNYGVMRFNATTKILIDDFASPDVAVGFNDITATSSQEFWGYGQEFIYKFELSNNEWIQTAKYALPFDNEGVSLAVTHGLTYVGNSQFAAYSPNTGLIYIIQLPE